MEELNFIEKNQIKSYKRRWIILILYILYSGANSFQWMEYSIITNIIKRYYNVDSLTVDWTSIIYMILYPIMVVPVSYFVHKKGLRFAGILGCLGTALATFIKIFSLEQDKFYLILCAQAFGSAAQVFILCLPAKLAATWFKTEQVATICSLGFFGTQIGFGLGFVVPSTTIKNEDVEDIRKNMNILNWCLTIFMAVVMLGVFLGFQSNPKRPPSFQQYSINRKRIAEEQQMTFNTFFSSFVQLLKQKAFFIHTWAYGINVGVYSALGTFINQFVLQYFENAEKDAGQMGLTMILCGAFGSILFGYHLDKTRSYKKITFFIYLSSCISIFAFIMALKTKNLLIVYTSLAIVGLFMTSYMPIGFEIAVELTYPAEESTTSGIMVANTQLLGVVFTLLAGKMNWHFGADWTLVCLGLFLLLGTFITYFIPNERRRQDALKL